MGCQSDTKFLEGIDFSNGDYSIYVKHKTLGEFIVVDETALRNNIDNVKINLSLANFLPGEGDRSFGLLLFKNNHLLKSKTGGLFGTFEIGSLKEHSLPVSKRSFSGKKKDIQIKLDSINQNKNLFVSQKPKFFQNGNEFSFRVYFPSIAVPIERTKDSLGREVRTITNDFNEVKIKNQIKECILNLAKPSSNFEVTIASGHSSNGYLVDKNGVLRTADNKVVYIDDFIFYQFEAYIRADEKTINKLITLNYSNCLTKEQRFRDVLYTKITEKVLLSLKSTLNVDKGEVWLSGYSDSVATGEIYEQDYSLTWLEAIK
jgi:hypothetical protein